MTDLLIVRKKKKCIDSQEQDASLGGNVEVNTLSQFIDHDPHMPSDKLKCGILEKLISHAKQTSIQM